MGKLRKRMSFSRIEEILDMPDLIEVQKNSYKRFLEVDLKEVLDDVSPIVDYTENLIAGVRGLFAGRDAEIHDLRTLQGKRHDLCGSFEGVCPSDEP